MPQLLVVNRRPRKKRRARAARSASGRFVKHHVARKKHRSSARRARRARRKRAVRVVHVNRRPRRHVVRSRHRRPRRHNPRLLAGFQPKKIVGQVMSAAIGAGGALALDIVLGKVQSSLPASLQSGWGLTAAKIAGAVGLGWGASKVLGSEKGKLVAYGALTVVAYGVLKKLILENAPGFASSVGLSAYMSDYTAYPQMGFTDPAPRLGAYMPQPGMAAYMPGSVDTVSGYNDGM